MSMPSMSIAQFYRVNTLGIWLNQLYSTRVWIICYSSFNSIMMSPDVETDVLLIIARPFQNVCCNNVGNLTRSKVILVPMKFSSCINTTVDGPSMTSRKLNHLPGRSACGFSYCNMLGRTIFVSVRGKIPFPFYRITHPWGEGGIPPKYSHCIQLPTASASQKYNHAGRGGGNILRRISSIPCKQWALKKGTRYVKNVYPPSINLWLISKSHVQSSSP